MNLSLLLETKYENKEVWNTWIRKDIKDQNYTSVCRQTEIDIDGEKKKKGGGWILRVAHSRWPSQTNARENPWKETTNPKETESVLQTVKTEAGAQEKNILFYF